MKYPSKYEWYLYTLVSVLAIAACVYTIYQIATGQPTSYDQAYDELEPIRP